MAVDVLAHEYRHQVHDMITRQPYRAQEPGPFYVVSLLHGYWVVDKRVRVSKCHF